MLRAVMCMPYNINHFLLRTVATSNDEQAKVENVITHLSIIQNVNIIQKARLKDKRSESEVRPFGNN